MSSLPPSDEMWEEYGRSVEVAVAAVPPAAVVDVDHEAAVEVGHETVVEADVAQDEAGVHALLGLLGIARPQARVAGSAGRGWPAASAVWSWPPSPGPSCCCPASRDTHLAV